MPDDVDYVTNALIGMKENWPARMQAVALIRELQRQLKQNSNSCGGVESRHALTGCFDPSGRSSNGLVKPGFNRAGEIQQLG
jgi:hypothetical protein